MTKKEKQLSQFGFSFKRGGAHSSRTMMLDELRALLTYVDQTDAEKSDYRRAIIHENCLSKRSRINRTLSCDHLTALYSLDRSYVIFRTLLYFWNRDAEAQPLLALLCAYARDSIFRSTATFILKFPEGERIFRSSLEEFIDSLNPNRFSKATLKSTARNINSTLTKSGHLTGRTVKVRSQAVPTAGSLSYALLLGYLAGARGQVLFQTEYAKLLDCTFHTGIELAEYASRKGWIVFKRVGTIIEVLFPNLINQTELEWLHEQS